MEENWADALSGFVGVWQRVQGSGPEPASGKTEPEYETMKRFIRSEAAGQRLYSALARLTEGRCADTFAGMAAECGRGLKRLQTVCFLVTGDTVIPETEQLPAALRASQRAAVPASAASQAEQREGRQAVRQERAC